METKENKQEELRMSPIYNLELDALKVRMNELIHHVIHDLHDHSTVLLDDDPSNDSVGFRRVLFDLQELNRLVQCRMHL